MRMAALLKRLRLRLSLGGVSGVASGLPVIDYFTASPAGITAGREVRKAKLLYAPFLLVDYSDGATLQL